MSILFWILFGFAAVFLALGVALLAVDEAGEAPREFYCLSCATALLAIALRVAP